MRCALEILEYGEDDKIKSLAFHNNSGKFISFLNDEHYFYLKVLCILKIFASKMNNLMNNLHSNFSISSISIEGTFKGYFIYNYI